MVATCNHAVEEGRELSVTLTDGRVCPVREVATRDPHLDIAILRVNLEDHPVVNMGASGRTNIGARIYVIGNPEGLRNTISDGLLAAKRGDWKNRNRSDQGRLLQITAPVSHGSSGSPVFDEKGRVIGMVRAALLDGQNLNFAVPIDDIAELWNLALKRRETASQSRSILEKYTKAVLYFEPSLSPAEGKAVAGSLILHSNVYSLDARLVMAVVATDGMLPRLQGRDPDSLICRTARHLHRFLEEFRQKGVSEVSQDQLEAALTFWYRDAGRSAEETEKYTAQVMKRYRQLCGVTD
jgi:Trypsin-like peptidase domain